MAKFRHIWSHCPGLEYFELITDLNESSVLPDPLYFLRVQVLKFWFLNKQNFVFLLKYAMILTK